MFILWATDCELVCTNTQHYIIVKWSKNDKKKIILQIKFWKVFNAFEFSFTCPSGGEICSQGNYGICHVLHKPGRYGRIACLCWKSGTEVYLLIGPGPIQPEQNYNGLIKHICVFEYLFAFVNPMVNLWQELKIFLQRTSLNTHF